MYKDALRVGCGVPVAIDGLLSLRGPCLAASGLAALPSGYAIT
jgi:hypothetical protein